MKREIFVCDRCGNSAEEPGAVRALDLHEVIIGTRRHWSGQGELPMPTTALHASWDKQWCLECRKATGLAVVMEKDYKTPMAEVPSFEDMIREIVRQELPQ
jgi:hypothetical protein